ncbi:hemin uptake protein HemP [Jiella sonneratiae]|uniref:Hemin uptake protein HemP n=1 Tax=Jiella sonneratiae TaxID=2816856 RepID=A0ABS3J1G3_9HYPH|nr:hemin uptake protein HemP [Jiella sonneratiae]
MHEDEEWVKPQGPAHDEPGVAPPRRSVAASELFGDGHEVEIRLGPAVYRLRLTKSGKLILNK